MGKNRVIAFYLPQYHPVPENDAWWGTGFTEWDNVSRAKPRFPGHVQPRVPGELGYYDLLEPGVREAQARLAREAGIEGFCYYHYWFGNGRVLLERPLQDMLSSGTPDFPFCLCWANHSWTSSSWTNVKPLKRPSRILMRQTYPGAADNEAHFNALLPAFRDPRYIRVDGKPLFAVFDPFRFKGVEGFISQWRALARENGLGDFHFVAVVRTANPSSYVLSRITAFRNREAVAEKWTRKALFKGFDAVADSNLPYARIRVAGIFKYSLHDIFTIKLGIKWPFVFRQDDINRYMLLEQERKENIYPTILPNWDCTPRNHSEIICTDSTPEVFGELAARTSELVAGKSQEHRIIFVKSWNEWGEGNYMEPDEQYGRGYIDALKDNC